jgi:hypothetical protein
MVKELQREIFERGGERRVPEIIRFHKQLRCPNIFSEHCQLNTVIVSVGSLSGVIAQS